MFLSRKQSEHICIALSLVALFNVRNVEGQTATNSLQDVVVWLNKPKLKTLLSQPGGLESAALQAKHLVVDTYASPLVSKDLVALGQTSDVVALCNVLGQTASINSTTNIVTTRVSLRVDEALKGKPPSTLYIDVPGGRMSFGNDSVADVRSVETKGIGNGLEILIFLSSTSDRVIFQPNNGMEGIFWVSVPTGQVTSITRYDNHAHLVKDTSLTLSALRKQLFQE